jgi:hypothetical protein
MKIKQTIIILALLIGLGAIMVGPTVAAINNCGVETSIINCDNVKVDTSGHVETTGVWSLLLTVINIMTTGIGVLAVAGIVYGAIMYSAAGDSAEKVSKARAIIRNVVIGIIAYALMYAGLNFLIPGGLFKP